MAKVNKGTGYSHHPILYERMSLQVLNNIASTHVLVVSLGL